MIYLGRQRPGSLLYIPFESFAGSTGAPITITGFAVGDIKVYKNGSTTERASSSGYALLDTDGIDFDGITGIHGFSIDLSDNTTADFWACGSRYFVVISPITVDGQAVSFVAAQFRIGYESSILDTTIATIATQLSFTLTAGPAEDDAFNGCALVIHDQASAVQQSIAMVADYTGATKTVTLAAAPTFTVAANDNLSVFLPILQATIPGRMLTIGSTGIVESNVVQLGGVAQSAADLKDFADTGYDPSPHKVAGVVLTDTTTALTNAPTAGDLTATMKTSVTTAATAAVPTATAVTGAVGSVAAGGITAASFAAGAINAAAIAADAIGASELAADAVTEIQSGLATAAALSTAQTDLTTLIGRVTAARAGYWDNLNVGGVVASQADITALNQSASRRLILTTVGQYERPESGTSTYTVELRTYDGDGAAVNADSTPTLTPTGIVSGDLSAQLSAASTPATGVYRWTYTVLAAATVEQVRFDASATIAASTFTLSAYTQVVNLVAATWTSTDASNLTAVFNKLPTKATLTGTNNTDGDVELNDATGNYPGSVGSVVADVGITQAGADKAWTSAARSLTDKLGFALSTAGIQAVWDALTSALSTVGSIGKLLVDNINATIGSRASQATLDTLAGYVDTEVAAIKVKTDALPASPAAVADIPTAGAIADQVWDEVLAGHLAGGSTGAALNGAGSAGDPWGTALPGAYGAGSAGKILGDNLNATVASRAATGAAMALTTGERDTLTDAIVDQALAGHTTAGTVGGALNSASSAGDPWGTALPGAYGAGTAGKIVGDNVNATVSSRASQASLDDLPTNAELTTALWAADDATLAAIAALNNLSQANVRSAVGLGSANLDTQLGDLPTNAELTAALAAADDATLLAIAALLNLSSAQVQTAVAAALAAYPAATTAQVAAVTSTISAAIIALNNLSSVQVKAQVVEALATDTYAEPGQEDPPATTNLATKIGYGFKSWRNRKVGDGTTEKLYNADGDVVDQQATTSVAAGVVTKGTVESGP